MKLNGSVKSYIHHTGSNKSRKENMDITVQMISVYKCITHYYNIDNMHCINEVILMRKCGVIACLID